MILLFGGTTEGYRAGRILDFIREPYFYSTKEAPNQCPEGQLITGNMDVPAMYEFCRNHSVRLIIDAAHPFAEILHKNIKETSQRLNIPVIRYERKRADIPHYTNICRFDSFQEISDRVLASNVKTILALTGVNSIPLLKKIWHNKTCYFRILDRPDSQEKATKYGFPEKYLIRSSLSENVNHLVKFCEKAHIDLILTKDTGSSGYLHNKIKAAERLNLPVWILKRPELPVMDYTVSSEKEFLQRLYLLRRKLFRDKTTLRSGYSTGTCVTAAVRACFLALTEYKFPCSAHVVLPGGETAEFLVFSGKRHSEKRASCIVIKDAGDDPDITHSQEIGCTLSMTDGQGIEFRKGEGIGEVTLNGLELQIGEPAINPVPRQMIKKMLLSLAADYGVNGGFCVTPFIPGGKEMAARTFNPRVGVIGGLSILGTSGKVIPYSHEAFLATIKHQLSILQQTGCDEVVLTSGKRSEKMIRDRFATLPDQAFIHFGNMVGDALNYLNTSNIKKINVALMLGKSIKLAEGHCNTHSKKASFNPDFASRIAKYCEFSDDIIEQIKRQSMANSILEILPFEKHLCFYSAIAKRCYEQCAMILPPDRKLTFILLTMKGHVYL